MALISMSGVREAFAPGTTGYNSVFVNLYYDDVANTFVLVNDVTGVNTTVGGGSGLAEYGYFYQTVANVTGTIAANNGKALFHAAGANNTAGLTTVADSGDITVGLTAGGKYKVTFSVSGAETNAFGVFVNGAVATGSIYGSGAGTQQNTGSCFVTLVAGDVVSVRTVNCAAAVTLQLAGTTNDAQVCASVLLEKVAA